MEKQNHTTEINEMIGEFYDVIENELEKLIFLGLVSKLSCERKDFYDQIVKVHQEVREANHKIRHFILMKTGKIRKENTNKIPLLDIITGFSSEIEKEYWNFIHRIYLLLESQHENKQEDVINTIGVELQKRQNNEAERLLALKVKKEQEQALLEQKVKLRQDRDNAKDIPNIDDMMAQMNNNPELLEMFNNMTGNTKDINKLMKQTMGENPEMATMLKSVMGAMNDGETGSADMMSMIEQFVPDMDMNCHVNIVLINKIYHDIVFIFSTDDDANSNIKDRIVNKLGIYRSMIEKGKLTPNEVISCVWKISTNEEMTEHITNMPKADVTLDIGLTIATEVLPKEWLDSFGDIEQIKGMMGGMMGGENSPDITSLMNMFKAANSGAMPQIEEELTEEQMAELEKFYDENK